MSEWIKLSEQKPKGGSGLYLVFGQDMYWVEALPFGVGVEYWMPLPDPPPCTVTIEISEDDARAVAEDMVVFTPSFKRVVEACRKALEAKR